MNTSFKQFIKSHPRFNYLCRKWIAQSYLRQKPARVHGAQLFVGPSFMRSGRFEGAETDIISKHLNSETLFINIGANVGYYCVLALAHGCRVVAFEPVFENFLVLCKNIELNCGINQCELHFCALADSIGLIELFGGGTTASLIPGWSSAPTTARGLVPCNTLDHLLGHRPQDDKPIFVLMDVEGAEHMVLRGAKHFLAREPKPTWMVEIAIDEHLPQGQTRNPKLLETFTQFWDHGYIAETADAARTPVTQEALAAVASGGPNPFAVHNFLFRAPS